MPSPAHDSLYVGRTLEELKLADRLRLVGKWIAVEMYKESSVKQERSGAQLDLKLRAMRAIADTTAGCIRQLREQGLDPRDFELTYVRHPY